MWLSRPINLDWEGWAARSILLHQGLCLRQATVGNGSQLTSPFVLHLLLVCQERYLTSLSFSCLSLQLSDKYHFSGYFYWGKRSTKWAYFCQVLNMVAPVPLLITSPSHNWKVCSAVATMINSKTDYQIYHLWEPRKVIECLHPFLLMCKWE